MCGLREFELVFFLDFGMLSLLSLLKKGGKKVKGITSLILTFQGNTILSQKEKLGERESKV